MFGRKKPPEHQDFEALVCRQENRIYRLALSILGNVQDAEDQTQETFLRYLEKRPVFENEAHESAWLLTVTRNGCISRLRSKSRQNLPLETDIPTPGPEEREEIEELFRLPAEDRAVIHLYYYEGWSTGEIARMTGAKEGTVRSRLSRARGKLRALLEEVEG
ncbi:MAG: RNA polymerase sigma factor [Clostridiales bacterium]|nr:RNA polymerase sigma factor [Clostridiales bacterium]